MAFASAAHSLWEFLLFFHQVRFKSGAFVLLKQHEEGEKWHGVHIWAHLDRIAHGDTEVLGLSAMFESLGLRCRPTVL